MWKKKNNRNLVIILIFVMITGIVSSSISASSFFANQPFISLQQQITRDTPGPVDDRLAFHTYDQMVADLQLITSTYPSITQLYDLGHSVQGRIIYGLKITDNPTVEENEPEFRIIGAHHGNEKMAAEVPLEMCWYLTQNYGTVPLVTHLVDEREIWIIPIMNVDGHVANSRYNNNGVDLNRDYGYVWGPGWTSPSPYSQPETKAIRNHAFNSTFGLSLSFHCSGDICNYVWNYKPEHTVDDALVYDFSVDYAAHNGYWVVEGYDWYQTRGDTNDFSYGCRGDIDWTIEIQSSNFEQAWSLNRDAILEMMNNQDIGLKGIVTDATTGLPLKATVWSEPNFWPCFTDPVLGDYHRLLLPGDYTVHFQANGYQEQIHNVHIAGSTPVVLDVALSPGGNRYAYQVVWAYIYDPYPEAGGNNFINNPTEVIAALGINDGQFASLGKGGSVCVDMAESGEILNGPGNDFTVYEGTTPEGYTVYVSQTGEYSGSWVSLGSATGTASFDLATGGVSRARYVKIADDNVGDAYETNPGFDLDAIQTLNPVQGISAEQSFVTLTNENLPHLFTCPASDGPVYQHVKVTCKTAGGTPVPGIPADVFTFILGNVDAIWYGTLDCTFTPVDSVTNANGEIRFTMKGDTSIYGNITIKANVQGMLLNDLDILPCKTADYFGDGMVALGDFVVFGQDYGRVRWRSDFSGDGGMVGLGDFVMFGQHYGHHHS